MSVIKYASLINLGLIVLAAFSIADILKKKGFVKSRLYAFNLLPYIKNAKKLYVEGEQNLRIWVKLLIICAGLLIPLELFALLLND